MSSTTCVLLSVLAVCCLHISSTEGARKLGRDLGEIFKRNAWWSKKSAEYASHPGGLFEEELELKPETGLGTVIDCYSGECVPDLLLCAGQAPTEPMFAQCRLQHRVCAARCFRGQNDD